MAILRHLRRPSLFTRLIAMAVMVLLPALFFSALLIVQFSNQQQQLAANQVRDIANLVSNAVDREIYGLLTTGRVLATSSTLATDDLSEFHRRTGAALSNSGTSAVLVDRSLQVVMSTNEAYPMVPRPVVVTETVEDVFRTGRYQISNVYYGEAQQAFLFHVAVPVRNADNRIENVLVISKPTEALSQVLPAANLPHRWSALIQDRLGRRVFAAVSADGELQPREDVSQNNPSVLETFGEETPPDLIESSVVSSFSGWRTMLGVPNDEIFESAARSWWMLLSVGALLFVFSVLVGLFFGRRIAVPIRALSKQATAIGRGEPATPIQTNIWEIHEVSRILSHASRDRRDAEEQNHFLMREMTHRAKNQYALVAAIARRAAKESSSTGQFLDTLSSALGSLANSADLLANRGWESVAIADLAHKQLSAFGAGEDDQIRLSGPPVQLNATAAQTIGLALHELATNAAKYGALSVESGRVDLEWRVAEEELKVCWRESGGPTVSAPKRSGFGTLVTQKMTARGLGGRVHMEYAPTGVIWELTAPVDAAVEKG